jgi:predicted RNA-binding protein with EMAP domain
MNEMWLFKKDITASYAYWIVNLHPFLPINLTEIIIAINNKISYIFIEDDSILNMKKFNNDQLHSLLCNINQLPEIQELNHRYIEKFSDNSEDVKFLLNNQNVSKFLKDFIDLDALRMNIFNSITKENENIQQPINQIQQSVGRAIRKSTPPKIYKI